jgi:hypothetical protein
MLLGIVIEVRPELENADAPIVVTLLGIVIEVRAVQPLNKPGLISVRLLGD